MPSKKRKQQQPDPVLLCLEGLTVAIQNLFILQAVQAGIKKQNVRKILRIGMNRVTAISRYLNQVK